MTSTGGKRCTLRRLRDGCSALHLRHHTASSFSSSSSAVKASMQSSRVQPPPRPRRCWGMGTESSQKGSYVVCRCPHSRHSTVLCSCPQKRSLTNELLWRSWRPHRRSALSSSVSPRGVSSSSYGGTTLTRLRPSCRQSSRRRMYSWRSCCAHPWNCSASPAIAFLNEAGRMLPPLPPHSSPIKLANSLVTLPLLSPARLLRSPSHPEVFAKYSAIPGV
mmetsp:Transcript_23349/g.73091  ORF Transcript_23349/g.73091 Transcript_23349/m.73091 type:complete len:219 (-) Transcript_23349:598-1254(-)